MKQKVKEIYTILVLIANLIFRRKHYTLTFKAEEINGPSTNQYSVKFWYYDFKHWGFDKHSLLMVSGADKLCEMYAQGNNEVTVEIIASKREQHVNNEEYDHYEADDFVMNGHSFIDRRLYKIIYGRDYHSVGQNETKTFWICPVTLFVLGRYPKHIYIKKNVK
jgi:hypothetical protein